MTEQRRPSRKILLIKTELEKRFPNTTVEYIERIDGDWFEVTLDNDVSDTELDQISDQMYDVVREYFPVDNRDDYSPSVAVITPAMQAEELARAEEAKRNRDCIYCKGSHPPEDNCWDRMVRDHGWTKESWERLQILNKDFAERRGEIMAAYDVYLKEEIRLRDAKKPYNHDSRESYLAACAAWWDFVRAQPSHEEQNDARFALAVARGVSPFEVDPPGWVHPRDR